MNRQMRQPPHSARLPGADRRRPQHGLAGELVDGVRTEHGDLLEVLVPVGLRRGEADLLFVSGAEHLVLVLGGAGWVVTVVEDDGAALLGDQSELCGVNAAEGDLCATGARADHQGARAWLACAVSLAYAIASRGVGVTVSIGQHSDAEHRAQRVVLVRRHVGLEDVDAILLQQIGH